MIAISTLVPVYNADAFIREPMDSVLSRLFRNFELPIMDDGSTDRSAAIIRSCSVRSE